MHAIAMAPAFMAIAYMWFHVHNEAIHLTPDEKVHMIDHMADEQSHLSFEDRILVRELLSEIKQLRKEVQQLKEKD